MVPLLSRRSIVALSLGLIVGMLAGIGYWYVSPIAVHAQLGWPPVSVSGLTDDPPALYRSSVIIEATSPGATYESTKSQQRSAEFWAYKISTPAFYEFMINEVCELDPDFTQDVAEMHNALAREEEDLPWVRTVDTKVRYGDPVTRLEIRTIGLSPEQAQFLARLMPGLFEDFLVVEELNLRQAEYDQTVLEIESLKNDLAKARYELSLLASDTDSNYAALESSRVVAQAMVEALENELDSLSATLAALIAGDLIQSEEYATTLSQIERVSAQLAKVRHDLDSLEVEVLEGESNTQYGLAYAKVNALVRQLDELSALVASPVTKRDAEMVVSDLFVTYDPTPAEVVPVDKIRARNALMIGAVVGLGGAWLWLNRKKLLGRLRSTLASAQEKYGEDMGDHREDEE